VRLLCYSALGYSKSLAFKASQNAEGFTHTACLISILKQGTSSRKEISHAPEEADLVQLYAIYALKIKRQESVTLA
jgi:hypothetical protein